MVFPMNNEAKIELNGDSELTVRSEEMSAESEESTTDTTVDCSNGVCVLNWKPARSAA